MGIGTGEDCFKLGGDGMPFPSVVGMARPGGA